jgi:hypothetical protein
MQSWLKAKWSLGTPVPLQAGGYAVLNQRHRDEKLISAMQVQSFNQQYCLDVSSWSVGACQVILFNESNKVESKSIHVIR